MNAEPSSKPASRRRRAEDIDRHVGARIRGRRMMLGLTQQQMAALIGVTLQQASKYERGVSRVASGRLHYIARALSVDVGYFFEGMGRAGALVLTHQQRLLLKLARDFIAIPDRGRQEGVISLVRALAEPDAGPVAVRGSRRRQAPSGTF